MKTFRNLFLNLNLISATKEGNIQEVINILSKTSDMTLSKNFGITALMEAAGKGHKEIVKRIIEKVDVNNKYCEAALIRAVRGGYLETVKLLLDKGVSLTDKMGITALKVAKAIGSTEIITIIEDWHRNHPKKI